MRCVLVALTAGLIQPVLVAAQTPNGEALYRQHCASCHEGASMPRMPSREALRLVSPEAIETTLSSFAMRRQAASLSLAERRAVAEYLSGRPAGSYRAPLDLIPKAAYCSGDAAASRDLLGGPAWNGWGVDSRNSRFQPAQAAGLTAADVPRLQVKWAFGFPGVSASGSQVSIVGGRLYVGSRNGMVYSLDARTGCIAWAFQADAGVRSTPILASPRGGGASVYFG